MKEATTLSRVFYFDKISEGGIKMKRYFFTSESVTEGHPDKVCDKICDKILDEALRVDQNSHMAVEATIKDNFILLYGEATTKANLNYADIARKVLRDIGYTEDFEVMVKISEQSKEINEAVSKKVICAGDQGIMFGYACNETEELMPLPIMLANKLTKRLADVRKYEGANFLGPDGKAQVTVEYIDDKPLRVDTVVIACQHDSKISDSVRDNFIITEVIKKVLPEKLCDDNTKILINKGGSFTLGGPFADSGTTGRKIVVDTYGGFGRVGGGCFSSKDPSKVDRSAAYYARFVARNIVSHKLADRVEVGLSYVIGHAQPISIFIETFGTNKTDISEIEEYVSNNFNFSVDNIIKELDLKKPIYYDLASYGHFGRSGYAWEKDK